MADCASRTSAIARSAALVALCVVLASGAGCAGTLASEAGTSAVPMAGARDQSALRWQEGSEWRQLPLLDAGFRTTLASEPLRLYRYSRSLAFAVGRRVLFKSGPGVTLAELAREHPHLSDVLVLAELDGGRIWVASVAAPELLDAGLRDLRDDPRVRWAQPDVLKVPQGNTSERVLTPSYDMAGYSLRRDLELDAVSRISTGKGVGIAVIDSGIDLQHPDLRGIEVPFRYDTQTHSTDVSPQGKGDHHATLVAGVMFAGEQGGSRRGIAPDAALIAIRLASTWTSDIVLAFQVAFLAGADVINCSWDDPLVLQPLIEVLDNLAQHGRNGRGTLVVVAAGNHHRDSSGEASLSNRDEVLSVTALDHAGRVIAAFGEGVDIAAPSMLPSVTAATGGTPRYLGKTSAAAPVVSATLALLLAARPELSAEQARALLLRTATPILVAAPGDAMPVFGKVAPLAALNQTLSAQSEPQ